MTILTWCNECGEDMHEHGGRECEVCGEEFCFECIKEHEKYCDSSSSSYKDEDEDENS